MDCPYVRRALPRHYLRHSISCRSDVLQAKSQPCPGPKIVPPTLRTMSWNRVAVDRSWRRMPQETGYLLMRILWYSVISEPRGALPRSMAGDKIEMPSRTADVESEVIAIIGSDRIVMRTFTYSGLPFPVWQLSRIILPPF